MANIGIVSLNGGEYTPKIDVRSDTEKYVSGCRTCENMIPSIFGGVERRPGTEFIPNSEAFNKMLAAIFSHENNGLCHENTVVVSDYNTLLSQISCHENEILCYENEVVTESDNMAFLSKIMCYENEVLFYEGEIVIDE